jgi:hypothetical protein
MANNKVWIDVIVDDKGTTQRIAVSAKKLGKALGEAGVGAGAADRGLKGVGRQSSNSTKNFAKMAQGINGGLVPAYAILAAQIFAVSAAFNFLKSAGTLVTLQQGQVAYAAATGTALRTLAKDIMAATDAQITFQDASQAAAIGVASGLSPDQLTKLGKAARDTSFILGRDVTDSFNRLVRGVTKAEPELLDELGIILRLETATTQYARAINKNVKDLTAFERSQAVANDVLTQAEDKYGRILEVLDPQANQFAQLGVAFDTIVNKVKVLAVTVLGPLAKAFTEVPALAIAFLGIFAKGLITAMIPGMQEFGETAKTAAGKWSASSIKAKEDLKALQHQAVLTNKALKAQHAESIASQMEGMTFRAGGGFAEMQAGRGADLSNRQLSGMKQALKNQAGQFAVLDATVRAGWIATIDSMIVANKSLEASSGVTTARIGTFWTITAAKIRGAWASAMAGMATAAVGAANLINKAFFWLSIISTILTIGKIAWDKFFPKAPLTDAEKAAKNLQERMESLTEEYSSFTQVQNILNEGMDRSSDYLAAFGSRVNSLSLGEAKIALEGLAEAVLKYNVAILAANDAGFWDNLMAVMAGGVWGEASVPVDVTFEASVLRTGTEAQKASIKYYRDEVDAFRNNSDERAKASLAMGTYISTVEEYLNTGRAELIPQILAEKSAVAEITAVYASFQSQMKENTATAKEIFNKYIPETEYDRALTALKLEEETLGRMLKDKESLSATEVGRLLTIQRQIELIEELANAEHKLALVKKSNEARDIRAAIGATSGQRALIEQANKARDLEQERAELLRQRAEIERVIAEQGGGVANAAQLRALDINYYTLEVLKAQSEELERQRDLTKQLFDSGNQALETGLKGGIASLIKGDEKSIKDAMLIIAQSTLTSVADTLSSQITDMIMGTSPLQTAAAQAHIISSSFIAAGSVVAGRISAALLGTPTLSYTSSTPATARSPGVGKVGGVLNFLAGLIPGSSSGAVSNIGQAAVRTGSVNFVKDFVAPSLVPKPFANGGLVTSPTLGLVGEGRYNEAVVPLPNGKAIPVQMNGAGQNNNVTVNVALDSSGNATTSRTQDSQQAGNLGAIIAKAVQQELQNQKRSGGILNPYGVA